MCRQFDAGDEDDVGRLKKLFSVTQAILLAQAAKAEILEEELADMAKQEGKIDAKKGTPSKTTYVK